MSAIVTAARLGALCVMCHVHAVGAREEAQLGCWRNRRRQVDQESGVVSSMELSVETPRLLVSWGQVVP